MSNVRFIYIRNTNWEPIGCAAITVNRNKNRVEYGLSMRNPKDAVDSHNRRLPFDRKMAQALALSKLVTDQNRAFVFGNASMHDITSAVFKDIVARDQAPSGAIKFARDWLRVTDMYYPGMLIR